ncbi:putative quinol monooxygenase [Streptomyces sp. CRN 30]|uniref:putative quinol monooxygenase n=1 Tax=Streptomyces sp. CRN 30 TaxID=3075613 RepID=UPI002A836035|nr:antibiotic biosynthesis monooxygenase [Streptomyces sp. CRN 30]
MTQGLGLVVRFLLASDEAAAAFDDLCARTMEGIEEHEPGTLVYVRHTPPEEPLTRVFYELYADREAFEAHEAQEHVRHFLSERGQYLAGTEVIFLDAIDGKVAAQS